jgi:hypothetical protein
VSQGPEAAGEGPADRDPDDAAGEVDPGLAEDLDRQPARVIQPRQQAFQEGANSPIARFVRQRVAVYQDDRH